MNNIIANIKNLIKLSTSLLQSQTLLICMIIIISSVLSYLLGQNSQFLAKNSESVVFYDVPENPLNKKEISNIEDIGIERKVEQNNKTIFASKNGTKYYFPWCSGSSRVKLENRVYYESEESAKKSGKTVAAGCLNR